MDAYFHNSSSAAASLQGVESECVPMIFHIASDRKRQHCLLHCSDRVPCKAGIRLPRPTPADGSKKKKQLELLQALVDNDSRNTIALKILVNHFCGDQ